MRSQTHFYVLLQNYVFLRNWNKMFRVSDGRGGGWLPLFQNWAKSFIRHRMWCDMQLEKKWNKLTPTWFTFYIYTWITFMSLKHFSIICFRVSLSVCISDLTLNRIRVKHVAGKLILKSEIFFKEGNGLNFFFTF